jgi:hypothetical protein
MYRLLIALVLTSLLTACGKNGSSSDDVLIGQLMATGVQGLTYTTATQSGTTDALGHFKYKAGETISFSVGNLPLVQNIPAKEFMTFLDFDPTQNTTLQAGTIQNGLTIHTEAEKTVANTNIVSNVSRLLEMLDQNKIANEKEGIDIPDYEITNLNKALASMPDGVTIDFTVSPTDFALMPPADTTSIGNKKTIPSLNSTNASPANILLDKMCFSADLPESQRRNIEYGKITDSNGVVTTPATVIYKDTVTPEECLDPSAIEKALDTETGIKNDDDTAVAKLEAKIKTAQSDLAAAKKANDQAQVDAKQTVLDDLNSQLTSAQATQTTQDDRVKQLQTMIDKIAGARRNIGDISVSATQTYLSQQSGVFTSKISQRSALSPYAMRFPASDTSSKSVLLYFLAGQESLSNMEALSLNDNIASVSSYSAADKTVNFFATGTAGEETEIVVNYQLAGDYRWYRKTVRVLLQ